MKTYSLLIKRLAPVLVMLSLALGPLSPTVGMAFSDEPNNTCQTATDLGAVSFPVEIEGSLDTPPEVPDIDYYRFTATPGILIRADLGGVDSGSGTLLNPRIVLFDSGCNWLQTDDASGPGRDSKIYFSVPADGVFILAATSISDYDFNGLGNQSGNYRMVLNASLVTQAITGRIVDAVSGRPLPGDKDPEILINLLRCQIEQDMLYCGEVTFRSLADSEGRFRYEFDFRGNPLAAEQYALEVIARDYQYLLFGPFQASANQVTDLGDVALVPNPIKIRVSADCSEFLVKDGFCRFKAKVTNQQTVAMRGAVWSVVNASGLDSFQYYSTFQIGEPKPVRLVPGASKTFTFTLPLPSNVKDYFSLCTTVFFGMTVKKPYYNPMAQDDFCLNKETEGFRMVTGGEAFELARQMNGVGPVEKPEKPEP